MTWSSMACSLARRRAGLKVRGLRAHGHGWGLKADDRPHGIGYWSAKGVPKGRRRRDTCLKTTVLNPQTAASQRQQGRGVGAP